MNLCEIELFHIVWGVSKGTRIIIMKFGENNVLDRNISMTYSMTYTKIKFYIISIF